MPEKYYGRASAAYLTTMLLLGCAGMAATPAGQPGEASTGVAALAWLSGSWLREQQGSVSEEQWMRPAAGAMFGINRSIRDGETVFYEYLRIVEDDNGVVFYASPRGASETAFRLTESAPQMARFENPAHDFPQSITYSLDADTLSATIAGSVDGETRSRTWQWQRQR